MYESLMLPFSNGILEGLSSMNFGHSGSLSGVGKGSEDLDVDALSVANLYLHEEVGSSHNLLLNGNRVEVVEFLAGMFMNLRLQFDNHIVLFLSELRALVPSSSEHILCV